MASNPNLTHHGSGQKTGGSKESIKAISLKEPWASLVASGKKTIETRVWKTNFRGRLLICASKSPKSDISGKAVAIAELVDCRPMVKGDEKEACCEVYAGAYSWILRNVRPIAPFDVKGRLGLFDVQLDQRARRERVGKVSPKGLQ